MTKDSQFSEKPPTHSETMRELFSEKKESFIEALECLYIRKNQGGRLIFSEKWPAAAKQIFSDELVRYDHEGITDAEDRAKRAELEEEGEVRREQMLEVFDNIESRLVIYGSLQVEELDKIMAQINRPLAEYVFTDRFVDKYFPKPENHEEAEGETQPGSAGYVETQEFRSSETSLSTQEASPVNKESVEVPDIEVNSIGHVDHSFSSTTPSYKQGENGEDSEDMSWLDSSEEDEFGDIKPISTEGATAPAVTEPMPQSDMSPPLEMGLKAHQSNQTDNAPPPPSSPPPLPEDDDESDVGLFDSVRKEGTDESIDVPAAPSIEEPARAQAPAAEEPRRPMGMDGVRQAQEEQRRAPEPPPSQQPPPPPSQTGSDTPPPRPPMGMGALRQDQNPVQNQAPAQRPEDQFRPESETPPAAQEEKNDEKPAPRVPSLDDIDKHMSGSNSGTGSAPSGFPPIPGSEED